MKVIGKAEVEDTSQLTEFTLAADTGSIQTIAHGDTMTISGDGGAISTVVGSTDSLVVSHVDTSSQASVNNSGRTYIQDITLDTYGHVTGLTSATETVTNTDTNTTYGVSAEDGDEDEIKRIILTGSDGSQDAVSISASTGLSISRSDQKIILSCEVTDTNTQLSNAQVIAAIVASTDISSPDKASIKTNIGAAYSAAQVLDWTASQAQNIHADNYTDTNTQLSNAEVRSAVEAASDSNVFTDADHTKLNGIEASADVTDTANVTSAGALMDTEVTNLAQVKAFDSSDYATAAQGAKADSAQQPPSEGAFANGDKTKLDDIETGATADQTNAEIRTAVEAASDSNVFTDADHTKLNGISSGANRYVLPSANETTVGGVEIATTSEAAAGTDSIRVVTSAGVKAHVDARYSYQYLTFSFRVSSYISKTFVTPSQNGPEYYQWNNSHGVDGSEPASHTPAEMLVNENPDEQEYYIEVDYLDQPSAFVIPKGCLLEGFYGNSRTNNTSPNTARPVLGLFRAAEPSDSNNTDVIATCVAIDKYDTSTGNRKNRFMKLEQQGLNVALAQGDLLFPAIGLDTGMDNNSGQIWGSYTIVLKTLIP